MLSFQLFTLVPPPLLLSCILYRGGEFARRRGWYNLLKKCNSPTPLKGRDPLLVFETISDINPLLLSRSITPFRNKYFEDNLEHAVRIAKYNQPFKQLLLEMITQPDSRVFEEFESDEHPSLHWRLTAIAALQRDNILPSEIWDQYGDQAVKNIVESGHTHCRWRSLLPADGKEVIHSIFLTPSKHSISHRVYLTHLLFLLSMYLVSSQNRCRDSGCRSTLLRDAEEMDKQLNDHNNWEPILNEFSR